MFRNFLRFIVPGKVKKIILSLIPDETELIYQLFKIHPVNFRVMIDVGAGHGSTFAGFARNGWKVYAFEPDMENRKVCEQLYAKLDTVFIDPRAVSNKIETALGSIKTVSNFAYNCSQTFRFSISGSKA